MKLFVKQSCILISIQCYKQKKLSHMPKSNSHKRKQLLISVHYGQF